MSEISMEKSSMCWTCVKVVTLVCVALGSAYFVFWTYQSISRLETRSECLEGKMAAMGRNKGTGKMLKGDDGSLKEDAMKARIKKDAVTQTDGLKGEKGSRGAPGLPGRPGYKGEKGDQGVCSCTPPSPPPTIKPTLAPRVLDCRISKFGIPLHLSHTSHQQGFFARDVYRNGSGEERLYVGTGEHGSQLYVFDDLNHFRINKSSLHYDLPDELQGTEHIIYNGSLFYHVRNTRKIYKLHLASERVMAVAEFAGAVEQGNATLHPFGGSYFDIAYDGNGLWVFYKKNGAEGVLMVAKLSLESLEVEMTWGIVLEGRTFGNLMVVCGNLYLVRHASVIGSCIEHMYDLYTQRWSAVTLVFKVPYQHLCMLQYDPVDGKVYAWDDNNLLEYVMLFH